MNSREIHLVEDSSEHREDAKVARHRAGQIDRLKLQRFIYSRLGHRSWYPLERNMVIRIAAALN